MQQWIYFSGREVFVYTAASAAAGVAVIYAAIGAHVMRPLAHPVVVHLGRISYGGYLFHALVIWIIGAALATAPVAELEIGHRLLWFCAAWLATTGAAWLSYRWLERPIIEWSRMNKGASVVRRAVVSPPRAEASSLSTTARMSISIRGRRSGEDSSLTMVPAS